MKYLKHINESTDDTDIDDEYIKLCFVEVLDELEHDDGYSIVKYPYSDKFIDMTLQVPSLLEDDNLLFPGTDDFSIFIESSNKVSKFYHDIESALEKVRLKYPNGEISFSYYKNLEPVLIKIRISTVKLPHAKKM